MADLNDEILVGMIDEVFEQAEDVINDLEETNDIEQPADDPTIPDEDTDSGQASDDTPETVQAGDLIEPDDEDIITEQEENDLTEYAVAVQESQVTPVITNESVLPTIGNVEAGDRVMIALINGQPTVLGTVGSGDRQQEEINVISADVAVLGNVVAGKASISDLEATNAAVQNLQTTKANVSELNAATARITSLETNKADVTDLNATNAQVQNLKTTKAAITDLQATNANVTALQTSKADVTDLNAAKGRITTLEGDYANLNTVVAGKVDTNTLTANYITASQIATDYAKVDATNINTATIRNAWVDKVMVQTGLLANQGTVYTLDAIQLNADRITAGTIDVQRLIVTVDNHKYMVQFDAQGTPSYQKLDGDIIQDLTITADKIVAGAVTAQKITTANIVGTGGWINLRNGTFSYNNATSGQGISWDGTNLNINASTINIGTTNVMTTINDVKDAVDNISVGGRNILRNTANPTIQSGRLATGWSMQAGGNGTGSIETVSDSPVSGLTKTFRISNNTSGNRDFAQFFNQFNINFGGSWVFSCYVRGIGGSVKANIRSWNSTNGVAGFGYYKTVGTDWTRIVFRIPEDAPFDATADSSDVLDIRFGISGEGSIEYIAPKLERGNQVTDWTPAPEDVDASVTAVQTNADAINLSPYFSYSPYEANDYWNYWQDTPAITFTEGDDGWVRVQATNTGATTIRRDFYPKPNLEIKEGTDYTWLIEFRNNHSTGTATQTDFYIVQVTNCQFFGSTIKENIEGAGTSSNTNIINNVPLNTSTVYKKRFVKTSEATGSENWTNGSSDNLRGLACLTARCAKNATIDYEVRVSIYEGRYLGEYKPYVDQKARVIANTANTNASTALTTANTADSNASTALSTANTANTNASTALSTANTANTNASTALSTANTASSTASQAKTAVQNVQTLIRQYSSGVLVCKTNNSVGALVNADGSFDITGITWSNGVPSAGSSISSFSSSGIRLGSSSSSNYAFIDTDSFDIYHGNTNLVHFGYGNGTTISGGTDVAPYYTLGTRSTDSQTVGNYSLASGYSNIASGYASHSEGYSTLASDACSHAEGYDTEASGHSSHSQGRWTVASNICAHAEGNETTASSYCAHAEGNNTVASHYCAHAEGIGTLASSMYQHVMGKYNVQDSNNTYALIIGNGTAVDSRSNAFTVDWSGNVVSSGGATIGGNASITGTLDATGAITQNGTAVSLSGHNHAAGDITSGTLALGRGGTGNTGTSATTTISSIATAESGFTIESASYAKWGKLAMVYIVFKKDATAITTATNISLGTMVTGKRPKYRASAMTSWTQNALIYTDGVIHMYGTVAANATVGIYSTFILA